jgi:membrane-bound metal-dependent hydrolase YbcI (DUF457 family)
MPVTPFHFGVGLLAKGLAPARISVLAFAASQVVIDLETAYHLLRQEWPVHRALHTFALAVPVGLVAGGLVWYAGKRVAAGLAARWPRELGLGPALLGGGLGGLTHPLLDGVMHDDIQPLMPFTSDNPFHHAVGLGALHLLCVAAGFLGALAWIARRGARSD